MVIGEDRSAQEHGQGVMVDGELVRALPLWMSLRMPRSSGRSTTSAAGRLT